MQSSVHKDVTEWSALVDTDSITCMMSPHDESGVGSIVTYGLVKGIIQSWFFAKKTVAGSVTTLCNPPYT